ncbi:hypothetical protein HJC10_34040 [Corallococcus exiguus]|uniref:hypothetical protein n=1 Tax=Corallococcus TaxID=83461 RepID=UPI000ECC6FD7|nr:MULTISPECIES: hypothetical protein [Corallococcus]NNC07849.1 hypothetical protein [Corallococcus exiguus]NPC48187.1 hypothetical protein [Corallococcus exiguus]RKH85324.1 hypothetical protein D7X99_06310 [Corallococcus sp. AB032C]
MALSTSADFKSDLGMEPHRLLPVVSRLDDFIRPFCAALDHILQNRYPSRMVLQPQPYTNVHAKHGYSNTTEHETIRALRKVRTAEHLPFYENQLRDEHQLTKRKHHTGTSAFELGETD